MPGQNFSVTTRFAAGNNAGFQGTVTVTPPATGNNPQNIDQVVSTANATATPGHTAGDQRIAGPGSGASWLATSDIGYSASPVNNNGGGFGFSISLVSAGSGSGAQQVVIKFISTGGTTIKSYTLSITPGGAPSVIARDAVGVSSDLGSATISEIDCTPSPDGSVFEVFGTLNINL